MRKANQRGAYIAENVEGLVQSYVQHSDSFGQKFVQVLPEVLQQESSKPISMARSVRSRPGTHRPTQRQRQRVSGPNGHVVFPSKFKT